MSVSVVLLTTAAALLLLALGLHAPALPLGRGSIALLTLGSLLPVLDPLLFAIGTEDQIGLLDQPPVFAGPWAGLALIAAAAGAYAAVRRQTYPWRAALLAAAGLLLNLGLMAFTPVGTPWLAPFAPMRWAWAVFPAGHPVLVIVLAIVLAALEAWPRQRGKLAWAAAAVLICYAAAGFAGRLWAVRMAARMAAPAEQVLVEPANWAPWAWLVAVEEPQTYRVLAEHTGEASSAPVSIARWNDEPPLLVLLQDPLVRSFYYRVFRHPVARVDSQGAQLTLTLQELSDVSRGEAGATFTLSTDWAGRSRLYRVTRFD